MVIPVKNAHQRGTGIADRLLVIRRRKDAAVFYCFRRGMGVE